MALIAALLATLVGAGCGGVSRTTPRASVPVEVVSASKTPSPVPAVRVRPLRDGQFRVCTFVFHSPYELAMIQSQLPPNDFEFIELSPTGGTGEQGAKGAPPTLPVTDPAMGTAPGWLLNRCQPDLRCDIVVYSGEFAGRFFGKYGASLNVQEMEEASCRSQCQGLFHDPREVFLLACNTLATKSPDERTPREYLEVLLDHGFSQTEAERVVDLRYGPLGPSFRESVRRSFLGVPRIYGFSSVAPRGEITAAMLKEYFQRKGNYAQYLRRVGRESTLNRELLASFADTSLVQATGLMPLEPAAADRSLICQLYDESLAVERRLGIVQKLFARSDFLSFVPTVEVFLNRHPPKTFRGEERRLFAEIQLLKAPRRQLVDLMYGLHVSTLKMQIAHLTSQLGWITGDEFRRIAVEGVQQLLTEQPTTEVVDVACDLKQYVPAGAGLRSEEIPGRFFMEAEGYRLLDCLSPADARVSARMLEGLENSDEPTRLWAAYALSHRLPLDNAVLKALAPHVNDSSAGVRERVRWIFGAQVPLASNVLGAIRKHDPTLAEALDAYARTRR